MSPSIRITLISVVLYFATLSSTLAGEVTIPNTFQSGTPAVAAEVNANFTAVESAVDDNDNRIAALEAALAALQATVTAQADTIDTLQTRLAAVEGNPAMALGDYLTVDEVSDSRGPLVQLAGVNVQILNGEGSTDTVNGLGNLIVGYDEAGMAYDYFCSDGAYNDQGSCEGAGETWSLNQKTGSHYLVLGSENFYTQYGGIVAGHKNLVNNAYSTVTGGYGNIASGEYSSVSGGQGNKASGESGSVSGGFGNTASGDHSSVSGGANSGATGRGSSIIGGYENFASGASSSVSGGTSNSARGDSSSVSGGTGRIVYGGSDWRAGSLFEDE